MPLLPTLALLVPALLVASFLVPAFLAPAFLAPAAAAAAASTEGFAWQQHPGALVPVATVLHNEAGRAVPLVSLLGTTPAILDLGYFHCPSLCGLTRSDVFAALQASGLSPGQDVSIIAISIDPAETQADAASAKRADLALLSPGWFAGVHYLTASQASITALAQSVGFHAAWDAHFKQFMHPAGIVVLTRTGEISSYLLGVGYAPGDLRAAVLRAGNGGIAQAALPILLLCFHFDSTTGRYTLAVMKLLRLLGALTVLTILGTVWMLKRKEVRK